MQFLVKFYLDDQKYDEECHFLLIVHQINEYKKYMSLFFHPPISQPHIRYQQEIELNGIHIYLQIKRKLRKDVCAYIYNGKRSWR